MTRRKTPLLLLACLSVLAGACGREGHEHAEAAPCCSADAPAAAAAVPDTSLFLLDSRWSDQTGTSRQLQDFRGEVVVTAMIFTHCEYACPRIIGDLKRIESLISEDRRAQVRFLLVSMDTARDTPDVLAAYAQTRGLDPEHWTLLHGEDYAVRGYAAALGVRYKQSPDGAFSHSNLITVLHQDGRIAHQLEGLGADVEPSVEAILNCLPTS